MRRKIVAGNWKMNNTFSEAQELIEKIIENLKSQGKPDDVDVIVCPPAVYLELATDLVNEFPVMVGAQNLSDHEKGAYTGEIAAGMLNSMNVSFSIIGHSERRKYFGEADDILASKVILALDNNVNPIFCCGEQLEEREKGSYFDVVKGQLEKGLFHLSEEQLKKVVIAYEPVWAIGTGKTAKPEQAQEMHAFIRGLLKEKYSGDVAETTAILYGGSCNSGNAKELFANEDVDGGLIGGASLKADEFCKIIRSF
jgi:triosephosphate isomerase (TIM)